MSINLSVPKEAETTELKPRITVVGVGGAGGNAVNNMIRSQLEGVDFLVANTDAQALGQSRAEHRIQLGTHITQGLGAGSRPDVGRAAAEEAMEDIVTQLRGANMAFIAAGMGGGTGTGAAPVVARAARELGILTVGVVTKPFHFEGVHRMRLAEAGIQDLAEYVDTLIIIPNQNLFRIANEKTTFADAFSMADEVLYSGVRGVTDLMVMPGLINLDFADVRAVMGEMGKAMMGTGEASGERRALDAAEAAIANPLLDDTSMKGAKGVLINITGGPDMTLFEVDEAANRIRSEVDEDAYIIFGSAFDETLDGRIRVSVVATGIETVAGQRSLPTHLPQFQAVPRPTVTRPEIKGAREETRVPPAILVPASAKAEAKPIAEPVKIAEPAAEAEIEIETPTPEPVAEVAAPVEAAEAQPEPMPVAEPAPVAEEVPAVAVEPEPIPAPKPAPAAAMVRPAAMPSMGAKDVFIPPAPAEATGERTPAKPDPFAAAAMANGARESRPAVREVAKETPQPPAKPRGQSLFERVTGIGRIATPAAPAPERPAATIVEARPQAQPRLGGLDSADRVQASQPDEDLLDIPAFLRRQAN